MSTWKDGPRHQDPRDQSHRATHWKSLPSPGLGTWPPALLPLGEVFEPVGCATFGFLVFLYMPWKLGGDVGDKVAARPEAVVVSPHPELTVLQGCKGCVSQDRQ